MLPEMPYNRLGTSVAFTSNVRVCLPIVVNKNCVETLDFCGVDGKGCFHGFADDFLVSESEHIFVS